MLLQQAAGNPSASEMSASILLSGAAGAIGVALITIFYDRIKMSLNQKAERKALLRIVDVEIFDNIDVLGRFTDDPLSAASSPIASTFSISVWQQSRVKLAQLLPADHFEKLVLHYAAIDRIEMMLKEGVPEEDAADNAQEQLQLQAVRQSYKEMMARGAYIACEEGKNARNKSKKYLKKLPTYFPISQ